MNELVLDRQGRTFLVRPMTPGDAGLVRRGFSSLSAESLRLRFLSPVPRLTAGMVADLTAVDDDHLVLLAFEVASGQLAGGARAVRHRDDRTVADVAVTVGDAHQRRGVGGALLRLLRRAAADEGLTRFEGHVLVDNVAARALLAAVGARTTFEEPGVLRFDIGLRGRRRPSAAAALRSPAHGEGRLPAAG